MSRYTQPDTSDKEPGESWVEYWDRKREERHGPECQCVLCGPGGRVLARLAPLVLPEFDINAGREEI